MLFYEFGEDTKILTWIQLKDQKQFLQVLSKGDRDMGGDQIIRSNELKILNTLDVFYKNKLLI